MDTTLDRNASQKGDGGIPFSVKNKQQLKKRKTLDGSESASRNFSQYKNEWKSNATNFTEGSIMRNWTQTEK